MKATQKKTVKTASTAPLIALTPREKSEGESRCPKCGLIGDTEEFFGWRWMYGKRRSQSYCYSCRSSKKPAEVQVAATVTIDSTVIDRKSGKPIKPQSKKERKFSPAEPMLLCTWCRPAKRMHRAKQCRVCGYHACSKHIKLTEDNQPYCLGCHKPSPAPKLQSRTITISKGAEASCAQLPLPGLPQTDKITTDIAEVKKLYAKHYPGDCNAPRSWRFMVQKLAKKLPPSAMTAEALTKLESK